MRQVVFYTIDELIGAVQLVPIDQFAIGPLVAAIVVIGQLVVGR